MLALSVLLTTLWDVPYNTSVFEMLQRLIEFTPHTSIAFGNRCQEMGVRPSMGTVGDAYDNAMVESFFATLECELIARHNWKTKTEARLAVFAWIESWYNPHRRHSALNCQSPNNFERKNHDNTINPETQILPEL